MKKRLICLFMSILMIIPVCLMTGCGDQMKNADDMSDEASETAQTVTMYLMSEQHICTVEELAAIKDQYGGTSAEYIEAKAIYDAHEKVEAAMNKITKAKFKTQVNVYWYTEDEYYTIVDEKITNYIKDMQFREDANEAWEKFLEEQKDLGIENEFEIKELFDEQYPDYAPFIELVDPDETTVDTPEETIRTESGIVEIKYPEEGENQVDIVYIGGYELYEKYVKSDWLEGQKSWLEPLDEEFASGAKELNAYLNAAFFDAMKVDGIPYAVPTNSIIGEYTYMLVDKELYEGYLYPIEEVQDITSIADIYEFIKDVGESGLDVVPFTGELAISGTHFWSVDYQYKLATDLFGFEDGKSYYVKGANDKYLLVGRYVEGVEYFTLDDSTGHYVIHSGDKLKEGTAYYVLSPEAYVKADKFAKGVTYYTLDEDGNYIVAKDLAKFEDGTDYYKVEGRNYAKINTSDYDVSENVVFYTKENSEYIRVNSLSSFEKGKSYYVVRNADDLELTDLKNMYVAYGEFDEETEYYLADVTFKSDEFSLIGSAVNKDSNNNTKLSFESIFSEDMTYAEQLLAIKKIQENGFYDANAINEPNKTFAAAIVKGGAELVKKYEDKYAIITLDAPVADFSKMYDHMFGITKTTGNNRSRAMEILTLLNTDSEFRNLVQYGILGENYTLNTVEIDDEKYPQVVRLNKYYMMDINKTGNLFIAYPEEGMAVDAWEYGKLQNRDSRLDVLADFNINTQTSPDLELLDAMEALSAEWKAKLDACETSEELELVIAEIIEMSEDNELFDRLVNPDDGDIRSLNSIYNAWYSKKS